MIRSQRPIAIYDIAPSGLSPINAIRAHLGTIAEELQPTFVQIDLEHPYPASRLPPPDWLIVILAEGSEGHPGTDWRNVVDAAPLETRVMVLSHGGVERLPRSVVQQIDLTGWSGDVLDPRISTIAHRIAPRKPSGWNSDLEQDALDRGALIHVGDGTTMLNPVLLTRVADLGLSTATLRILTSDNLIFVGDLVQHTEAELLRLPDLGRKRLGEVQAALRAAGLTLGAIIPGWPPEDMEAAIAGAGPAEVLRHARQIPAGEMFAPRRDRLAIDPRAGGQSDRDAGASAMATQLQEVVRRKLGTLYPLAVRLGNQPGWHDLAPLCDRLAGLLERPGEQVPEVLGTIYGAALELGSFAELDDAARNDPQSSAAPLDPATRRPLQDVLSGLAPWLRLFPTIRQLDDEAGRFLGARAASGPARAAIAEAAASELIDAWDADRLRALLDAGERGGFLGGKAGRRGVLSVRNLVLASASLIGGMLWNAAVNDYAPQSALARRAATMLVGAEDAVVELASELPADVRAALRRVVDASKATGREAVPPSSRPGSAATARPGRDSRAPD